MEPSWPEQLPRCGAQFEPVARVAEDANKVVRQSEGECPEKGKCSKLQQTCHEIQGAPSRVTGSRNQWNNWPMESEGIRRVEQIWAFDLFERIINYRPGAGRKMATNLFGCEDEARLLHELIHCCRMPDVWPLGQL